jgi:hypothetical protein
MCRRGDQSRAEESRGEGKAVREGTRRKEDQMRRTIEDNGEEGREREAKRGKEKTLESKFN